MRCNYSFSGKRIVSFLLLLCFAASAFAFPASAEPTDALTVTEGKSSRSCGVRNETEQADS